MQTFESAQKQAVGLWRAQLADTERQIDTKRQIDTTKRKIYLCRCIGVDPSAGRSVGGRENKALIDDMIGSFEERGGYTFKVLKVANYGVYRNKITKGAMMYQLTTEKGMIFVQRFLVWQHVKTGNEPIKVNVVSSNDTIASIFYAVFDTKALSPGISWEHLCSLGEFPMTILDKDKFVNGVPKGWGLDKPMASRGKSSLHRHFCTVDNKRPGTPTHKRKTKRRKCPLKDLEVVRGGQNVERACVQGTRVSNKAEIEAKVSWLDDKGLTGRGLNGPLVDEIKALYRALLQTGTPAALAKYQKEELHDIYYVQEYIDVQQYLVIREPPLME